MDNILHNIQMWFFEKGANKDFGIWDVLGNKMQDLRDLLSGRK